MNPAALIKTYDEIALPYTRANYQPNFWVKEFGIFKKLIKGRKVLDIGCGHGRDAVLFVRAGFDYTGIDGSESMLREARKRVKKAKFIKMNFYKISLPKKSFHGFWASAVILHVPKERVLTMLKSFKKLLKPGGVGFVSVKAKSGFD